MGRAAKATRNVTSRELSRRTSDLLDEIESNGSALVVIRYGRPCAVVVPFEDVSARPTLPRLSDLGGELSAWPKPSEDTDVELDEDQIGLVREIATCALLHWTPSQSDLPARRLIMALSNLEISGIVERGPGASRRLTARGERIASGLDSEA